MEHELPRVLDGVDEPVTVEELEGVVRRAGQRRRASLVAGAAALLAVGGVGGALARGPAGPSPTAGYAGGSRQSTPTTATHGDTASSSGFAMDGGTGQRLTPLFRREANGVAIRAYRTSWTDSAGKETPPCAPPDLLNGELSNGAAVTIAMAPFPSTKASAEPEPPLRVITVGSFGREEGEESTWVVARAAAPVAKVRVTVGGVSDTMEPQGGVALLAVPATGAAPVVEGLGADGAVVATEPAVESKIFQEPIDPACFPPSCVATDSGGGADGPPSPEQTQAMKEKEAAAIAATPAEGDHVRACAPMEIPPHPAETIVPSGSEPLRPPVTASIARPAPSAPASTTTAAPAP